MTRYPHKVWLNRTEFGMIKTKAENLGLSISGFMREAALRMAKNHD